MQAHARDYAAIDGIQRVVDWATSRDITIDFIRTQVGRFHSQSRRVEVSCHLPPENQLHIILHELGHFITEDQGHNYIVDNFPNGYRKIDDDTPGRGQLHKVDVIAEEFEAWTNARRLAESLSIYIDRLSFDKNRAKYLTSYFKWAMKRGRVSDE
jgi:hypothetical protein